MDVLDRRFTKNGFTFDTTEYGWDMEYDDGTEKHSIGINYKALPLTSSDEFILGYGRSVAISEGWIKL